MTFDLISDLHIDHKGLDWTQQSTSPICVVAGDVARDPQLLCDTLAHLAENYVAVLYIDGNEEHRDNLYDIGAHYSVLKNQIESIPRVTFLHDNVVIINGVAFLGTNAWWSFDWDSRFDPEECRLGLQEYYNIDHRATDQIMAMAINDHRYLSQSIKKLQTIPDVKRIVVASHTIPDGSLVFHDPDMSSNWRLNAGVNSYIRTALIEDTEHKVCCWCFGHYHWPVDQDLDGIRYICNPRGRFGTRWYRDPYFPQRIEI